jgi:adenosyl cobinamide kinase/adenosyl cobinamide phosphate guanylyltransferase
MRLGTGFSLLVGGARSGKSDLAVRLGLAWDGDVVLIATASAGDADMERRIARHQEERPDDWVLIEAPLCSANDVTIPAPGALLIIDCVTMLTANLLFSQNDADEIDAHMTMLADALAARTGPSVVVSNEVGLGVHPETSLGREYRDILGRSNRRLADRAETSLFVSAGRVVALEELDVSWDR